MKKIRLVRHLKALLIFVVFPLKLISGGGEGEFVDYAEDSVEARYRALHTGSLAKEPVGTGRNPRLPGLDPALYGVDGQK